MRLLNQMLNLSSIFVCVSRRFDKVVFNLKLLIQTSHLKAATSRIKLPGKCENRQLSWAMIIASSIIKNTGRYAMIICHFL